MTFQFLVVVPDSQVFKVFFQDRVQQCRLSSRTLIFQLPVEVFNVFPRTGFSSFFLSGSLCCCVKHCVCAVLRVFSHFSPAQKKCEGRCALECESARALELIHAERSSNGAWHFGRAGEPGRAYRVVRRRARAGVVPLRGPSGQVLLAPAHHGPLPMGATVGAQAVKVPQIQFFDDKVAGSSSSWTRSRRAQRCATTVVDAR